MAVSADVDPTELRSIIAESEDIPEKSIDVIQKDAGYNYFWKEEELLSFSDSVWYDRLPSISTDGLRVVSLTNPISHDYRLASVVATADIIVDSIVDGIRSTLQKRNSPLHAIGYSLHYGLISELPDEFLADLSEIYVERPQTSPIAMTHHVMNPMTTEPTRRRLALAETPRPWKSVAVSLAFRSIPMTVRANGELVIHRTDIDFVILPSLILDLFATFGGRVDVR